MAAMWAALLALAHGAELLPDFHFAAGPGEHFELGLAMGRSYREAIAARVAAHGPEELIQHCGSWQALRSYHEAVVPELMEELRGTAEGSGVHFDHLLAVSLQVARLRSI